jgi:hypothetical protein
MSTLLWIIIYLVSKRTVGANLFAKNVNDDAFILDKRGAFKFFASKLAPTGVSGVA